MLHGGSVTLLWSWLLYQKYNPKQCSATRPLGSPLSRKFVYSMAPLPKANVRDFGSQLLSPMTANNGGFKLFSCPAQIFNYNSWSTITTSDFEWPRRKTTVSAFKLILTQFTAAPAIGTPKYVSYKAGALGAITATCQGRPGRYYSAANKLEDNIKLNPAQDEN